MAKKALSVESSSKKTSVFDIISKFDKSAEVLGESKTAVISDYIDTGSYILNAAISGSLFKGVPAGRCTVLAGDPGTGKSYLALSICRNAQKKGYTPIYMDSESAIDLDFVKRLGCDPNNFIIKQVTTISEVSTFIAKTCKTMIEMPEDERPKIIFVLDSLGNLTSDKELNDTIEGNGKKDMTKQQETKALFRTNATILGRLGYPFVVNSHIYRTQEMFSKTIVTGGCLVPNEQIITEHGNKKILEIVEGDCVRTVDGTYKEVVKTFRYEKPTIKLYFSDKRSIECSYEHRFFIGGDFADDSCWVQAKDIKTGDWIMDSVGRRMIVDAICYDPKEKTVCDLCVDGNHTYVSANGIINHNSGINFNASVTLLLSTAKLDDRESEKIAEKKVGEYTKTGVIVTAKPEKSRFTIPQKVKFWIPFFKAPNPYIGLEAYLTWENSGIMKGKIISEKEYEKLSDLEKQVCEEMKNDKGEKCYAFPKDTSKNIIVKHLGCEVPAIELFSDKVLTKDILKNLDETIIRPSFELPSSEKNDDISEFLGEDD